MQGRAGRTYFNGASPRRTLFLQPSGLDEHVAQAFHPPTFGIAMRSIRAANSISTTSPGLAPAHIILEHFIWAQPL
jgi:hypothetical protein